MFVSINFYCVHIHTYVHTLFHTPGYSSILHLRASSCYPLLCRRISLQNLQRFEHVRVIRGVLQLQGWDSSLPPLDFFRNVEYIGMSNLSSSSSSNSSLGIFNLTGLDRIDLSNLRQILFGNVEISMNGELCYVGDFQTNLTSVYLTVQGEQNLITGPYPFRSVQECGKLCTLW